MSENEVELNVVEKKVKNSVFKSYFICLKKYFKFSGRATRYEFWSFQFVNILIALITAFFGLISYIYTALIFIPSIALTSRRLHDVNRSFWWATVPYILSIVLTSVTAVCSYLGVSLEVVQALRSVYVVLGFIFVFYNLLLLFWFCTKGDKGDNKYGKSENI